MLMRRLGGAAAPSRCSLRQPRRCFQVIQRGHDRPQPSLFDKLGFSKDNEAHRVRRDVGELQQGLLRQVEQLNDPTHDPADRAQLAELKAAYTLLHDDNFRANYASHSYASNDARLHVLCDGGQVAANFNPEHQQFSYVDHAIDREGSAGSLGGGGGGEERDGDGRSSRSYHAHQAEAPSAEALNNAYRNATGVGASSSGATAASAQAFRHSDAEAPANGSDIAHLLRLTLEQSLGGCEVPIELHKNTRCVSCRGSGRQRLSKRRKCPQCLGRGSTHMPSATYHIERRCLYCGGEGTMPAPACRACEGRGVLLGTPTRVEVRVPAGTMTNTLFRLRHHGHDGVRGGQAGDLLVTVVVGEHRYFYRHRERRSELHAMLPLPLSVALLGGRVAVPTLAGTGVLHVPPCVRNGQILPFSVYGVKEHMTQRAAEEEGRDEAASAETAGTESGVKGAELFFHALVMIPRVGDLSGRQREALGVYEAAHAFSSAQESLHSDGEAEQQQQQQQQQEDQEGEGKRVVEAAVDGSAEQQSATERVPSRDELMEECAALKTAYRHWFTAN